MKRYQNPRALLRISLAALLAGLVIACIGYASGAVLHISLGWDGPQIVKPEHVQVQTQGVPDFENLVVESGTGATIRVLPADAFSLDMNFYDGTRPQYRVEQGTLIISANSPQDGPSVQILSMEGLRQPDNTIEVRLPGALEGADVRSAFGDITIEGLTCDALYVSQSSGDTRLSNVSAHSLTCESAFGDVTLLDVRADALELHTNSGDVTARGGEHQSADITTDFGRTQLEDWTSGALTLRSGSGDTHLSGDLRGHTQINASFGDVRIEARAPRERYALDVRAEFGTIRVNGERVSGLSDAQGPEDSISVHSASGDVTLTFAK